MAPRHHAETASDVTEPTHGAPHFRAHLKSQKLRRMLPNRHMVRLISELISNHSVVVKTSDDQYSRQKRNNNGLPNEIKSDIYMFADDTTVFRTIKTNDDQCILKDYLDELTAWSTKWLLTFHPDKCKIMHLCKPLEDQFKYTLHYGTLRHELGYTSEEKDIGVIIDSNLEFDKHVYFKVNKANSTMAVIRRSFQKLDEDTFVPLHKALVRTHLYYAYCIWSPYKQKYKDALENVQRRATKQINGMSDMCYPDRLRKLKLPTPR